ncbi:MULTISPECIES: patatin-like phospholipase family protein [Turicibacter]|uniref:Phospholipase n=3 Tax=Turicibacter sanguinis TaxID=154288 RepID=A0A173QUL5_9FIRM|nr:MULTISPECIES: patatin-like phospholipase family protein [Turicibacter]EFF64167.1 phospholipase, patatin family [Turicibacter sanguinis PC909]EGC92554.1 phospholipase, patatin family [Turicibacter sp. HGF1]MBP3904966.1 patatin-like phospholipase family protein [Turicibacter sp.]MCU7191193.1 patatin-like phospholipase family protein [Turicibacter sanguinis]MCU7196359.1 patatin-like phospholipase family protein [Turicibacter sanguinis]
MKNIGLVLCGGGAKGAYQVGVFKVLEELEIANEIKMISGSSIGALNGALYLMYSADEIDQIWQQCNWTAIFGVSKENIKKVNQIVHRVNTRQMSPFFGAINMVGVANQTGLPLQRKGFEKVLRQYLKPSIIQKQSIDLIVSCGKVNSKQLAYFNLNHQSPKKMQDILFATTAVPMLYNPVYIDNSYYCDPMKYERAPLAPLLKSDCETIIIVYLNRGQCLGRKEINGKRLIEIAPSRDLGTGIYGSFDFRKSVIENSIELGGNDAYRILYNVLKENPRPPRYLKKK